MGDHPDPRLLATLPDTALSRTVGGLPSRTDSVGTSAESRECTGIA